MEIFKLLDRFEILYPHDERLADLRRSYIDQNLHSIFKLSTDNEDLRKAIIEENVHSIFRCIDNQRCVGDIEDLRKAVLENNLHSLFRLLPGNEDLRKSILDKNLYSIFRLLDNEDLKGLVLHDNIYSLWRILDKWTETNFVAAFKKLIKEEIDFDQDCFSRGQLQSKLWLVNTLKELDVDLGIVFLCAGWYGTLATMIFESNINVDKIVSFDIDPEVWKIAEIFNKPWVQDGWRFKAVTEDIFDIMFNEHIYDVVKSDGTTERLYTTPDTIINTSCEHINNFTQWFNRIPKGKLVILQSNNYFEVEEHVNCSDSLEQFNSNTDLTQTLYLGELKFPKYTRFMKIGYK